jgi:hypothetical protein
MQIITTRSIHSGFPLPWYTYGIGQLGVQLAFKYVTGKKAGIKKHYGTGSAIVTRANVGSASIKKYLYTP